jgi:predicted acyltransferase
MNKRLQSLDALRGFDMFWIAGGGGIFAGLAALTKWPVLQWWAAQMEHAQWHGFTFEDMIFPLFLFIAGISFPFSLAKRYADRSQKKQLYFHILRRGLLLTLFGIIYNGLLRFDFETMRYASVLGRIGLAWMFAALIFIHTGKTARFIWCAGILAGYWLLLAFVPAPDYPAAARFSIEGNFAGYFDRLFLPGRLYLGIHDPEGIFSTIPAISTALLGMLTGRFIMFHKEGLSETRKTAYLAVAGVGLVIVGLLWDFAFPINKNLWSSSFVCLVGGLSMLLFCLFYWIIDVHGYHKWAFFFIIIGMNSITIYLSQGVLDIWYTSDFLFGGLVGLFPESWHELLGSSAYVAVSWFFLYILYKKKIFLKI